MLPLHCTHQVNNELSDAYAALTPSGGECYISYSSDMCELLNGGVIMMTKVNRHTSWRSIDRLSGGQQALCGLALSLAAQRTSPSPLYIMDELDAALDASSVKRAAQLLRTKATSAHAAQYIVVSHRPQMREQCTGIIGLYRLCGSAAAISVPVSVTATA
jgi:chromosome segregation ATPase